MSTPAVRAPGSASLVSLLCALGVVSCGDDALRGLPSGPTAPNAPIPAPETTPSPQPKPDEPTCEATGSCPVRPTGSVRGRICAGEGYWLSGARVFVESGGQVAETTTDGDGYFTLGGVPVGHHVVQVTRGSFSTQFEVDVQPDAATVLPEPVCIAPVTRIAVVTGTYDHVENVLAELDFPVRARYDSSGETVVSPDGNVDLISGTGDLFDDGGYWLEEFLADPERLSQYQVIFFNCGIHDEALASMQPATRAALDNLVAFVHAGGSVYASDWASEVVRAAFPGRVALYGPGGYSQSRLGKATPAQAATILDLGLHQAMGRGQVTINFNLEQWSLLATYAEQPADVTTLVRANVTIWRSFPLTTGSLADSPIVVRFDHGDGRVLYTAAHTESQTTDDLKLILKYIVFEL